MPPEDPTTTVLADRADGPGAHRVELSTPHAYFLESLGFDPLEGLRLADWLSTPSQILRTLTAGQVFRDDLGLLTETRTRKLVSLYANP